LTQHQRFQNRQTGGRNSIARCIHDEMRARDKHGQLVYTNNNSTLQYLQ